MQNKHLKDKPNLPPMPDTALERVRWLMDCLRDPEAGCPWDLQQDFKSIIPYTIEEAYEVADAIEHGTMDDVKEELGDLLLQVAFYARMAQEQGMFDLYAIADTLTQKMMARHPHVFGNKEITSEKDLNTLWDKQKEAEKGATTDTGALSGVARGLPALMRAEKLLKRAAKAGYVWPDTHAAFAKLEEEISEFKEACAENDPAHREEEFGDLLFCLVNFARMNGINSEEALRKANDKFYKRFNGMEHEIKEKYKDMSAAPLDVMLAAWKRQK